MIESSIASYFGKPSKSSSEKIVWQVRGGPDDSISSTLLVGTYASSENLNNPKLNDAEKPKIKIAAFDLVGSWDLS